MRAEWGCDAPTEHPQLFVPCACAGAKDECQACGGVGLEPLHRCPNVLIDAQAIRLLELHRLWPGTMPQAGGLYDQPALYVDAMLFLDRACSRMEREAREQEEEMRPHGEH